MNLRKIDALIAEKVLGWRVEVWKDAADERWRYLYYPMPASPLHGIPVPAYTNDIAHAWEVVEHFMRNGTDFHLSANFLGSTEGNRWRAGCTPIHNGDGTFAEADSAPLAICLAALKAKGVEVPDE